MKNIITLFTCLLIAAVLQAQTGNTKWLTQEDSLFHFTYQYPENWTLKLPGTQTRFFVTSKPENENDNFKENINCIAKDLNVPNFNIKDEEANLKESLKSQMPDFKLLASSYKKWNGTDALCIDFTTTQKSGDNTYYIRIYQQVAVLKGILYVLTYTAETGTFSKYWDTVSTIMLSVKPAP